VLSDDREEAIRVGARPVVVDAGAGAAAGVGGLLTGI
jgi:hypothetical protein